MPDNFDHLDDAFLDGAWQDMQARLDVAMPVRRRRRPVLFWWSSAAALVLLTAGSWWFVAGPEQQPAAPRQEESLVQRPAATPPAAPSVVIPPKEEPAAEEVAAADTPPRPVQRSTGIYASPRVSTPVQVLPPTAGVAEAEVSIADPVVGVQEEPAVKAPELTLPADEVAQSTAPAPPAEEAAADMAAAEAALLGDPAVDYALPAPVERPRSLQLEVATGAITDASSVGGAYAGLRLAKPVGRRLAISSGLQGEQRVQTVDFGKAGSAGFSSEDFNSGQDPQGNTSGTPTNTGNYQEYLNQSTLQELEGRTMWLTVPLEVAYRLTDRLSLQGGVFGGYLLRENVRLPAAAAFSTLTFAERVYDNRAGFSPTAGAQDPAPNHTLSRWQAGLRAGVNFRLGKRLTATANWQHDLGAWYPEDFPALHPDQFGLGLRYRLR